MEKWLPLWHLINFNNKVIEVLQSNSEADDKRFRLKDNMKTSNWLLLAKKIINITFLVFTIDLSLIYKPFYNSIQSLFAQVSYGIIGLFFTQKRYAKKILQKANMLNCKPQSTLLLVWIVAHVAIDSFHNATLYRALVGSLQYLSFTRLDLTFALNYACQFMHSPIDFHYNLVKCILSYVKSTHNFGHTISTLSNLKIVAYFDSDWAGCRLTRRSTTGFVTFLGTYAISQSSRKQQTVSRLSAKAEYRALAPTITDLTWLGFIHKDWKIWLAATPILYFDNLSALHLHVNPVFHARSKHIE